MSGLTIEKNVPLPLANTANGLALWTKLEVNDSVFMAALTVQQAYNRVAYVKRKHGWKFTLRRVTENGVDGVRVWRVA